jgi:adenosylmethionine-8-amino-7-oxononanoate aminotransferase
MRTDTTRTTEELVELDRRHLIHPFLPDLVEPRVVMARGEGCHLWDRDGNRFLDASGGLWIGHVGHGRRELAEAAAAQMLQLEYSTTFGNLTHEPVIELATRLIDLAPGDLPRVFFTSGGSEGNESAIKMVRYFRHRRGEADRTVVLARRGSYHGFGYGSGTLTGPGASHTGFGPLVPDVVHLTPPMPNHTELFDGQDPTDFCVAELERTIAEVGAERITAMIGEPIFGVGGAHVPPEDYWPRIEAVLRDHGILLIFDEVVTAYGRLGHWFAAERYGVTPDVIVTAKGITSGYLPLGAVLVSEEIAEVLGQRNGLPFGPTYAGHPVACAVALENLELIEREGLLERAATVGRRMLDGLLDLQELDVVDHVRGEGLMLGIELVRDPDTRQPIAGAEGIGLQNALRMQRGVMVRVAGHNLMASPPLVLTDEQADEIVAAIRWALEGGVALGETAELPGAQPAYVLTA